MFPLLPPPARSPRRLPRSVSRSLPLLTIPLLALAVLATAPAARAGDYIIEESPTYTYGMNDQNYTGNNYGPTACAPTSVINSFTYLQNRYGITGLIPHTAGNDAAEDASQAINELETDMDTNENGTADGNMVAGKEEYLEAHGFGDSISIEVQATSPAADATPTIPTWQFLFDQLSKGQDVELGFNWGNTSGNGGHWITVTGMDFDDANDNDEIDPGEATISFIDPWGGEAITGNLSMGGPSDDYLSISYSGGAAGQPADPDNPTDAGFGYADIIVAESPIPEPATALLLFVGGSLLLTRRR